MPTLNIGGRKVTVGDEFLKLSPEQQNATVDEIAKSLPAGPPVSPAGGSALARPASETSSPEVGLPKTERFLQSVTPAGPISGAIALLRTAGQAAQGKRSDLMTNPENAIPEAVWGGGLVAGGRAGIRPPGEPPAPLVPPGQPKMLTYNPEPPSLASVRTDTKRVAQGLRDTGQMPAESSGAPIEVPAGPGQTPPESPLLPSETVREFAAVRKGVELKDRLNPESPTNVTARDAAMAAARDAALRPHLNSIMATGRRTTAPEAALDAALPAGAFKDALTDPAKAASLANWMRVYERAARGKFSPEAQKSLGLATKNLNNNLGTDLTLSDILGGP